MLSRTNAPYCATLCPCQQSLHHKAYHHRNALQSSADYRISHKFMFPMTCSKPNIFICLAWSKTSVTSVCWSWSYSYVTLSHRYHQIIREQAFVTQASYFDSVSKQYLSNINIKKCSEFMKRLSQTILEAYRVSWKFRLWRYNVYAVLTLNAFMHVLIGCLHERVGVHEGAREGVYMDESIY